MDNTKDPVRVLREALEQIAVRMPDSIMSRIANDALAKTAAIPHSEQRETGNPSFTSSSDVAAGEVKPVGHFRLFNGWYLQLDPKCWPDGDESTTPLYAAPVAAPVPEAAQFYVELAASQTQLPNDMQPTSAQLWDMYATDPVPEAKALTFDRIEDAFPDGAVSSVNGITVSAQWLHDFARNVWRLKAKPAVSPSLHSVKHEASELGDVSDSAAEAPKLARILFGLCEGGGLGEDIKIYADDFQAGDGDVYVYRAAELLVTMAAENKMLGGLIRLLESKLSPAAPSINDGARAEFEASRNRGHDYDLNEFGQYKNPLVEHDYSLWVAGRPATPPIAVQGSVADDAVQFMLNLSVDVIRALQNTDRQPLADLMQQGVKMLADSRSPVVSNETPSTTVAAAPEVWCVESKHMRLYFSSEDAAKSFISGVSSALSGGMQIFKIHVITPHVSTPQKK